MNKKEQLRGGGKCTGVPGLWEVKIVIMHIVQVQNYKITITKHFDIEIIMKTQLLFVAGKFVRPRLENKTMSE